MMGDWKDSDIPTPCGQLNSKRQASSPGQAVSDSSLLSIDMPIRQSDSKRHVFADRQMFWLVADTRVGTEISALRKRLAELRVHQTAAVSCPAGHCYSQNSCAQHFSAITHTASAVESHDLVINNLSAQAELPWAQVMTAAAKSNSAATDDREATDMKAMETGMTALRKMFYF